MPSETPQHVNWSDIPADPLNPLLTRQFIHGAQAMIARIVLKKGCVVPRHSHPHEQIAFITEGLMRFTLGDEGNTTDFLIKAGDVLVIPGNTPHSAEALEDSVDFDVFSPPREDWITGDDSYLRGNR